MKKAAPEVRMTEAARKRSAKIRQDKESADQNAKPASPRLRSRPGSATTGSIPRAKSLSSEKAERLKLERYV